jgi:NADPH:quinone reductase-like Zn-dependent oxidoreductase
MRAITVSDREAGVAGLSLTELPQPEAATNDVVVRVHAASFIPGELDWPDTWTDRAGRDRTPSAPGHDLSGVVVESGYGTTGLSVGQRVFGLVDWTRYGSLAEYTAVEARNLAPLPIDVDHTVAAALPSAPVGPQIETGPSRSAFMHSSTWRLKSWRMQGNSTWCST